MRQIEDRFGVSVNFVADDKHNGVDFFAVEWGEPVLPLVEGSAFEAQPRQLAAPSRVDAEEEQEETSDADRAGREGGEDRSAADAEGSQRRRRRRRRRRGGGEREAESGQPHAASAPGHHAQASDEGESDHDTSEMKEDDAGFSRPANGAEQPRKRRRGRRGGRARRDDGDFAASPEAGGPASSTPIERHASSFSSPDEREDDGEPQGAREVAHEGTQAASLEPAQASGNSWNDAETELRERAPQAAETAPSSEEPAASAQEAGHAQTATPTDEKPAEPVLTSTYDPARAKRAGWWAKVRASATAKE